MTTTTNQTETQTDQLETVSNCLVCGKPGVPLYTGLRDALFGVAGAWTLLQCREDGHTWISPRLTPEFIGLAYSTYYTHGEASGPPPLKARIREHVVNSILCFQLGYHGGPRSPLRWLTGAAFSLIPSAGDFALSGAMWLRSNPGGRLLDVGCGNGALIGRMAKLGWDVFGVEPDPTAVAVAAKRVGSAKVTRGVLIDAKFDAGSFDAITMHHVIEHNHEPDLVIREMFRILKAGGYAAITTPNLNSLCHRRFRAAWRELDPPRHLHLFSIQSLSELMRRAGFEIVVARTTARSAWEVWCASRAIEEDGRIDGPMPRSLSKRRKLQGLVYGLLQHFRTKFDRHCGEGLVMIARKPV